jgi:hypothetical protein
LYHPHEYFTQKGLIEKERNIESFSFVPRGARKIQIQQGLLSKASRHQLHSDLTSGETVGIEGPWYPGGTKMDTHKSRLRFANTSSKSDLLAMNTPSKRSVDKSLNFSKDKDNINFSGKSKLKSPQYMTTHLNSVKAKNRRNSNTEVNAIKISRLNFNPN